MSNSLRIVSSQLKLLPKYTDEQIEVHEIQRASTLRNEPFSFQILYKSEREWTPVSISVTCGGIPTEAWRVDSLAVFDPANRLQEPGFVDDDPGIMPDLLMTRPAVPELIHVPEVPGAKWFEKDVDNLLNANSRYYQSLWITVNPNSHLLPPGEYRFQIAMTELFQGQLLTDAEFTLEILNATLPKHDVYYTNWFYEDTICDFFNVPLYGEEFYRIFDEYLSNAVKHRQNTLLLPAFTPPLDTVVGQERMNVQLTDVRNIHGKWVFGFDRMKEFIDHAKVCGIQYFEHCHLFSQWGAKNTPNIYDVNGNRLFGHDTNALGEKYQTFIHAYLDAFFAFAKAEGIYDRLIFHISDEPAEDQLDAYRGAYESVAEALKDHPTADAMSHTVFYSEGLVKQPIPFIDKAPDFEAVDAPFWVYYTAGPNHKRCTNRLISTTAARTRILGVQMYRYNALGFLHWGYNYYYDRLTCGVFDPKANPCGYKQLPGCSYLAYPLMGYGETHVAPSIREKHMAEAFDDLRVLQLLETFVGRDQVLALCEKVLGEPVEYTTIPEQEDVFRLRQKINEKIKSYL